MVGDNFVGELLRNLRFAVRRLLYSKGTTVALLCMLALGACGASVTYSLIDRLVLHALPVRDPAGLVLLVGAATPRGGSRSAWWGRAGCFTGVAEYALGTAYLSRGSEAEPVLAATVSTSFFSVLGVAPIRGRPFSARDGRPGSARVALLSRGLWTDEFGATPDIIGRSLDLNGVDYAVVGIMPQGFTFPGRTQIWLCRWENGQPAYIDQSLNASWNLPNLPLTLKVQALIGRLAAGCKLATARAEVTVLGQQFGREYPSPGARPMPPRLLPLVEVIVRDARPAVLLLFAGSLFLLLIAWVNCANLLTLQAAHRQKEFAIRLALGATRGRILAELLTESSLVALAAGATGLLFAWWGMAVAREALSSMSPTLTYLRLDGGAVAFVVGASVAAGLLLGSAGAIYVLRANVRAVLGDEGFGSAGGLAPRLRRLLVVLQLSLTLALLTGATLTIRSFLNLTAVKPGLDFRNRLVLRLAMPGAGQASPPAVATAAPPDAARGPSYQEPAPARPSGPGRQPQSGGTPPLFEILRRLRALPGVVAAASTDDLPFGGQGGGNQCVDANGELCPTMAQVTTVSGDYFRAAGIALRAGRSFAEGGEPAGAMVVVISDVLAHRLWGSADALGQSFLVEGESEPRRVVGVVAAAKFSSLSQPDWPQLYLPLSQPYAGYAPRYVWLVVHVASDPAALARGVAGAISDSGKGIIAPRPQAWADMVETYTGSARLRGYLLGAFAGLAMLLSAMGVYAVVAFLTVARTRELAIRMVNGAKPGQVFRSVLGETAKLALVGTAAGLCLSLLVARSASALLFGVGATDPRAFASSALLTSVVGLAAGFLPAWRASRIQPADALRHG